MALEEIFMYEILNNELWKYLLFIVLLGLTYPFERILSFIVRRYVMNVTKKTKVKFFRSAVRSLIPPLTLFVFAFFFYLGSVILDVSRFEDLYYGILNFLLIIPLVMFMISFTTEVLSYYLKNSKVDVANDAAIDLLTQIVRVTLILIGILLVLSNLGYNISALLTGLGVGGLAFALASQDLLRNFFSGIVLIFDKTFNKGQRVNYDGNEGFIEELRMRSTKMRTYDGRLLTIPNSKLSDNVVQNISEVPQAMFNIKLKLPYDASSKTIEKVKKILEDSILNDQNSDPNLCWIWYDGFDDYSQNINAIFYSTLTMDDWPDRVFYKDRVSTSVKKELEKHRIKLAYPTQTIEMKQ